MFAPHRKGGMRQVTAALSLGLCVAQASHAQTVPAYALPALTPLPATASPLGVELLLLTRINSRDVGYQPVRKAPQGILMQRDGLAALGIRASALPATASGNDPWVMLQDLPGVNVTYNAPAQTLIVDLPFEHLNWPATELSTHSTSTLQAHAAPGVLLNYDLYAMQSSSQRSLNAMTELRAFRANAVLSNTMMSGWQSGTQLAGNTEANHLHNIRLDTSYSWAFPDDMVSLRVGDTLTASQPWSRATRIGGIQLGRNFALQPTRINTPIPAFMGTSALPSDIALYINGVRQYNGAVPAGPFVVNAPTGITGTGAAQVVLTDAFGRQTTLQYDFYGAQSLLARGVSDWSAELGWVRQQYGMRSFDYGSDPVASGSWSYGVSDQLTVQTHAEASAKLANLGGGGTWQAGPFGTVSAALAVSQHKGSSGHLQQLGHYWSNARFFVSSQATRASAGYRDAASLYELQRQKASGRFIAGYSHAAWGNLSGGLVYLQQFDNPAERYATIGWSKSLGQYGYISANLNHNLNDHRRSNASIALNWYLDGRINTGVTATRQNGTSNANAYASQARPTGGGWGWSTTAQTGASQSAQARVDYLGRQFEANATIAHSQGGATSTALGASGALIGMGGHWFAGRRTLDSFAVVSTNGIPDVPVKRDNLLVGQTDAAGVLLVPSLGAYRENKLSIDPMSLPAQLRLPATDQRVVPTDRAGTWVQFDIQRIRAASVTLHLPDGSPVALGSRARLRTGADGTRPALVGFDGVTYLENLSNDNTLDITLPNGNACVAYFSLTDTSAQVVPALGPVICNPKD